MAFLSHTIGIDVFQKMEVGTYWNILEPLSTTSKTIGRGPPLALPSPADEGHALGVNQLGEQSPTARGIVGR